jgi:hypothetical protein
VLLGEALGAHAQDLDVLLDQAEKRRLLGVKRRSCRGDGAEGAPRLDGDNFANPRQAEAAAGPRE